MPRKGPSRSKKQQRQSKFISTVRHRSRDELESGAAAAPDPPTSKADVQRLSREVVRLKKDIHNCARREQRLRERLMKKSDDETTLACAHKKTETTLQETEARHMEEVTKSNEKIQGLQKMVKRLRAHVGGDPKRIERAVQKGIKRATCGTSGPPNSRRVKTPAGVVEDWARDLICVLVGKHGTPASRAYDLVCSVADALGIKIIGRWSARTAGRAVDEGGLAAEQMIVDSVQNCMGMLVSISLRTVDERHHSTHIQRRWHRMQKHRT